MAQNILGDMFSQFVGVRFVFVTHIRFRLRLLRLLLFILIRRGTERSECLRACRGRPDQQIPIKS